MPSRIPQPKSNLESLRWKTKLDTFKPIHLEGSTKEHPQEIYVGENQKHEFFKDSVSSPPIPSIVGSIWGYGTDPSKIDSPGPTLIATENKSVYVRWKNNHKPSPEDPLGGIHHPFVEPPRELRSPGMMSRYDTGHAVAHLHGAHVPWTSDGYPMRVSDGMNQGVPTTIKTVLRPGESEVFEYPNTQPGGATLWYHDHTMDMTSMNVYAGLAGAYLLRHEKEDSLVSLPKDKYEIPLIIQDRSFTEDGKLLYGDAEFLSNYCPTATSMVKVNYPNFRSDFVAGQADSQLQKSITATDKLPSTISAQPSPEFKGQVICVNGKIWPYLEVQPRPYRFRIVNGSNSRMYALRVSSEQATDTPQINLETIGLLIYQIGSDGGLLSTSIPLDGISQDILDDKGNKILDDKGNKTTEVRSDHFLILAAGERADVIVNFSDNAGQVFYLTNHAQDLQPQKGSRIGNGGDDAALGTTDGILKFKVNLTLDLESTSITKLDEASLKKLGDELKTIASTPDLNWVEKTAPTRQYLIEEFGPVALTPEALNKIIHGGKPRGWKAITFQSNITVETKREPGYLWGGMAPDYGAVPNGNPRPIQEPDPNGFKLTPLPDPLPIASPHTLGCVVELWEFYNNSPDVHPIHLHHSSMRIHSRVPLDYSFGNMKLAKPIPMPPDPLLDNLDENERGWKDTVRVNPGQLTRILVRFDNGGDTTHPVDYYKGHYVWHCHILEHEDMGMMRPLEIE